jgi:hypothetical protein
VEFNSKKYIDAKGAAILGESISKLLNLDNLNLDLMYKY